jgi:hypothetical protein
VNLVEQAFKQLFPDKDFIFTAKITYSRAFKDYNANVKYRGTALEFRLSYLYKDVSEEIVIGLIQSLLLRIFKKKASTINIELYDKFIRNLPKYSRITRTDPALEASFARVNEKYFYSFLERPNLVWAGHNLTQLGSYHYASDTITVSRILEKDSNLLDYVMYHEMLHKKHKFYSKDGRSYHHTKLFRTKEKEFEDKKIEEKLKTLLRKKKIKRLFKFW